MDPVSVLGLVETCYTLGVKILDICSTWKHADSEVEKRVIIIESCWDRTKRQVDFVMRITSIMDEDHCRMMDELLNQLVLSLSLAMSSLETVIEKRSSARSGVFRLGFRAKKAAWVWKKEALDGIISELEEWQRRFDPSWFLLMKIANPVLDRELALAKTTEAKAHGLATAAKTPLALATGLRNVLSPSTEQTRSIVLKELQMEWLDIPFSVARMGRGRQGNDKKWYIVDTIELGQAARVRDVMQDVRVLATKLSQADPLAFGLLNCKGIVPVLQQPVSPTPPTQLTLDPSTSSSSLSRAHSPSPGQVRYSHIQLIFRVPRRTEKLQSLRQLLLHADEHISLSRKVYMARELAKAVNYVHTFAFVHKNVRPESVLCFEDPQAASSHAFLVGFGAFRGADAGTMMGGDMSWAHNIYLHPRRQGIEPSERYTIQHDIYSLGVCLLEIGLWESFVEYTNELEFKGRPQAKFGKSYYNFMAWSKKQGATASFDALAIQLKDFLVEQALTRLAPRMGDKYSQVVLSCLTCLDDDNEDFGGSDMAGNDDAIAVQFIERILKTLNNISL